MSRQKKTLRKDLEEIDTEVDVECFYDRNGGVHVPKDIALYYLSLCAAKAASDGNRDLVAGGEAFSDIVLHETRAARGDVALATLQAFIPADLATVDPAKIADLRLELAAERLKYQATIKALCAEFLCLASEGELNTVKDSIKEIAVERVESVIKYYRRAKWEMILKSFGVSLAPPALAASVASILGVGLFMPAGIAATLSLFSVQALLDFNKNRDELKNSDWSYVIEVAKTIK